MRAANTGNSPGRLLLRPYTPPDRTPTGAAAAQELEFSPREAEIVRSRPEPEPTHLERPDVTAVDQTAAMAAELPTPCDVRGKKDAKSRVMSRQGKKVHVDIGETGLPLTALTPLESLPDSQVTIPMVRITAQRVVPIHDLMDSAYDTEPTWHTSYDLQHVPIIDENPRRGQPSVPMKPNRARRYHQRYGSE